MPNEDAVEQRLQRAFEKALPLVVELPPEVQGAAFSVAVDQYLADETPSPPGTKPTPSKRKASGGRKAAEPSATQDGQDRAKSLARELNRTDYPQITASLGVLDRALHILKAARDDADMDGLTAPEIAEVLTTKFRIRTTASAVRMALDRGGLLVDRIPEGRSNLYRLMQAGENRLSETPEGV